MASELTDCSVVRGPVDSVHHAMDALSIVFLQEGERCFRFEAPLREPSPCFVVREGLVEVIVDGPSDVPDACEWLSELAVALCEEGWRDVSCTPNHVTASHVMTAHELLLRAGNALFPARSAWYHDVRRGARPWAHEVWGFLVGENSSRVVPIEGPDRPDASELGFEQVRGVVGDVLGRALEQSNGNVTWVASDHGLTVARRESFALLIVHPVDKAGAILSLLRRAADVYDTGAPVD